MLRQFPRGKNRFQSALKKYVEGECMGNYPPVPIITRASEIIDYIGQSHSGKSASELMTKFRLPKTTCYRILHTLTECEFLQLDVHTGLYYLGKKFSDYATTMDNKLHLLQKIAHPYMEKLALETQETVKISVLSNMRCYVLDKVEGPRNIKITVDIGTMFPLHAGASSKILFMSMGNRTRNILFSKSLERFTSHTITSQADMLAEFRRIEDQGYAVDMGEYIEGIGAIACPIYDYSDKIIAAISVAFTTLSTKPETYSAFLPSLKATALTIGELFSKSCTDATL